MGEGGGCGRRTSVPWREAGPERFAAGGELKLVR